MNPTTSMNIFFASIAALGTFFLVGGLMGTITLPRLSRKSFLDEDEGELSFSERLARDISSLFSRDEEEATLLERKISQSGGLYPNEAAFYQRKFMYMLVFALFALIIGVGAAFLMDVPVFIASLLVVAAGIAGLFAPDSELNERLKERQEKLRREMTFALPRFVQAIEKYGSIQSALSEMTGPGAESRSAIPETDTAERAEQTRASQLGASVIGMGGGIFAEFLNTMASMLLSSPDAQFDSIRRRLAMYYPMPLDVIAFLDVVEQGVKGFPMIRTLKSLKESMYSELTEELHEAKADAQRDVVIGSGIGLVPMLALLGAPALVYAFRLFS
jgi:hypothetical protein